MAQFYAHIQGSRGPASRLGCKASGMNVSVKSWQGQVRVRMHTDRDGTDWATVTLEPHSGAYHGMGGSVTLYHGPCNGWEDYHERGDLGRMVWNAEYLGSPSGARSVYGRKAA